MLKSRHRCLVESFFPNHLHFFLYVLRSWCLWCYCFPFLKPTAQFYPKYSRTCGIPFYFTRQPRAPFLNALSLTWMFGSTSPSSPYTPGGPLLILSHHVLLFIYFSRLSPLTLLSILGFLPNLFITFISPLFADKKMYYSCNHLFSLPCFCYCSDEVPAIIQSGL